GVALLLRALECRILLLGEARAARCERAGEKQSDRGSGEEGTHADDCTPKKTGAEQHPICTDTPRLRTPTTPLLQSRKSRFRNPRVRTMLGPLQGGSMKLALSSRFDPRTSRKMFGIAASAAVHAALLLFIMFGGNQFGIDSGDTPTSKLVLIEEPDAEQRDG